LRGSVALALHLTVQYMIRLSEVCDGICKNMNGDNEPENAAKKSKGLVARQAGFLMRNGPLAILASSMPGFVNYALILYLVYAATPAAAGDYRIAMSSFALAGLVSMQESTKLFVRSAATDDIDSYATIFLLRLTACAVFLGLGIVLLLLAPGLLGQNVSHALLPVLALSLFYYPLDIFNSWYQAKQKFTAMALVACAKYLAALAAFIIAMQAGASVYQATLWQISVMLIVNFVVMWVLVGRDIFSALADNFNFSGRLKSAPSRESIVLSLANMMPSSLEHVDKVLIGSFFGLEALGLYTLGFSTGRFIYNSIKPALYIYYAKFVEKMPPKKLLRFIFWSFTAFGLLLTSGFYGAIAYVPQLNKFEGAKTVTAILFISYGIAMLDAVYTQAYALNKATNSNHVLVANTIASILCFILFAVAVQMPVFTAMILFAAHYPLRHGITVFTLGWLRQSQNRSAE
jgi:O-antigen/teichoic acid export membrane protein